MKSIRIFSILFFVICLSQVSMGQIKGSAHDFSNEGWNTSTGKQICIVCHTPHNAKVSPEAPLWNHQLTQSSFTVYDANVSPTLDATVGQPSGSSKLCLSCHDGTVALENYGTMTAGSNAIDGGANFGTDLSNDHPISFLYNTALSSTDQGLHNPSSALSGLGGTISDDLLFGGKMECASCHDVHNAAGLNDLLRVSNNASALCLTCHNK